jgi:putative ABC transport system substrate-binding protein
VNLAADDPEVPVRVGAFAQGLAELGWIIGRNVRIEYRWSAGDTDLNHKFAAELIALRPDVVLAAGTLSTASLQRASRAVPIVFVNVTDPLGAGFVDGLARPGVIPPVSCSTPTVLPGTLSLAQSRPWRRRLGSK